MPYERDREDPGDHSEQDVVRPGDVVMVDVDVTVQFDSRPRPTS